MIYVAVAFAVAVVVIILLMSRMVNKTLDYLEEVQKENSKERGILLDRIQAPQLVESRALEIESGAVRYAPDAEEEYKYADAEKAPSST